MKTSKQLILCVDDEKVVLNSLRQQLQSGLGNSYDYEIAESAEEAWEIIEDFDNIDMVLIISDWMMPGVKGDEFLVQLHAKFPNTITMMLTGQAEGSAIENAKNNANLHTCLRKPWSKDDLIEAINEALKNRKIDL